MEIGITDKEAGIALLTGQIVEAWLNRQPIAKGAVTPQQISEVILSVRAALSMTIPGLEGVSPDRRPSLQAVN